MTPGIPRESIERRLDELRQEYDRGTTVAADMDAQYRSIREQLLRIAGAIRVLEELAAHDDPHATTDADPSS